MSQEPWIVHVTVHHPMHLGHHLPVEERTVEIMEVTSMEAVCPMGLILPNCIRSHRIARREATFGHPSCPHFLPSPNSVLRHTCFPLWGSTVSTCTGVVVRPLKSDGRACCGSGVWEFQQDMLSHSPRLYKDTSLIRLLTGIN